MDPITVFRLAFDREMEIRREVERMSRRLDDLPVKNLDQAAAPSTPRRLSFSWLFSRFRRSQVGEPCCETC